MAEQLNIILVPHTHWDREWYQTFQQFRLRLVRAVDTLLNILDHDTDFSHFMLDGQTIVLDDYLEIRPEEEEHLKQYTRSGRILVGPWYVQPDEFLVSGESLIRNLQIGLQRAAEFGEPMRIGYVPDSFGHIAQLPQILQGFTIDNAIFWRGVGAEAEKSEFYWEAPDGTKVLVLHLSDPVGYSNARMMPLAPEDFATRTELLTAQLLPKATTNTLLFMNGSDHLEPQEGLPAAIAAANQLLAHLNPKHEQLLSLYAHPSNGKVFPYEGMSVRIGTLPQYVKSIRQQHNGKELQTLSGEMRSSQYSHLLPSVLSTRIWLKQENTAIEHMLEHEVEPLTAWAWKLGTPYPKGLVRLAWKYLLQNHPHDSICGCSIDQVHRENKTRFDQSQQIAEGAILQSLDAIVESIDTRSPVATTSIAHANHEPAPVVVFNLAPGPRTELVQATVQFPGSLRNAVLVDEQGKHMPFSVVQRWRQEIGSMPFARETVAAALALTGSDAPGTLIHMAEGMITTVLGQPEGAYSISRVHLEERSEPGIMHIEIMITPSGHAATPNADILASEQQWLALLQREDIHTLEVLLVDQARETLDFVAADLPAYGFKTFWVYPRGLKEDIHSHHSPAASPLIAQEGCIENEWYRVEARSEDGTLTVTDKKTGTVFSDLNRFVDGGDIGDLYNYCPPHQDTVISTPMEPPKIEIRREGEVRATLRITGRWSLPSTCSADRAERSSRTTTCTIVSEISLVPGRRRIDIHTTVDNKVKDHRLRVLFPVPYITDQVAAEGTFEVRTRPIAVTRPTNVAEWLEEPVNTAPQKRFVDISNGEIGLGILNRGLPEYEGLQDGQGVPPNGSAVALTLLRCVEWLSRGDLPNRHGHAGPMEPTPEAQCLGQHEFDYALVPHRGEWEAEEALSLREAQAFNIPLRTVVTAQHEGTLPSLTTLIEVEPRELVVSAIKQSNNGEAIIVRIYNPLSRAVEASLKPEFAYTNVFVTNLQEEHQEQLYLSGNIEEPIHIGVRSGEIITLAFI